MANLEQLHWQHRQLIESLQHSATHEHDATQTYQAAIAGVCALGLRHLYIRAQHLDPKLFNQEAVLDSLSSFARESRARQIHILLDQPEQLMQDDCQLLNLSRRLSQKIIIKRFEGIQNPEQNCWVFADQVGVVNIPQDAQMAGFCDLEDRVNHKKLKEQFLIDWQKASPARELRGLGGI